MNGRKIPPTGTELHRAWLELVDADGPFLAVPALKRVWPQGMPQPAGKELAALRDARPAFEKAWDRWDSNRDDKSAIEDYRQARDAWVNVILRDVLGWKTAYVTAADIAAQVRSPDRAVTVRPTGALVHRDTVGALVMPDASMVCGRAETIAHQLPSVTTPILTSDLRSSSSIRSIGLAAQPSASGSRSESTGSMTSTSAPTVSRWTSTPVGWTVTERSGERTCAASALPAVSFAVPAGSVAVT